MVSQASETQIQTTQDVVEIRAKDLYGWFARLGYERVLSDFIFAEREIIESGEYIYTLKQRIADVVTTIRVRERIWCDLRDGCKTDYKICWRSSLRRYYRCIDDPEGNTIVLARYIDHWVLVIPKTHKKKK